MGRPWAPPCLGYIRLQDGLLTVTGGIACGTGRVAYVVTRVLPTRPIMLHVVCECFFVVRAAELARGLGVPLPRHVEHVPFRRGHGHRIAWSYGYRLWTAYGYRRDCMRRYRPVCIWLQACFLPEFTICTMLCRSSLFVPSPLLSPFSVWSLPVHWMCTCKGL